MPEQYVTKDSETGLEITITGDFPADPDDRVRIARTATLFTRLFATILATENDTDRRHRFRAIETQLEIAEALIRETMSTMGVTEEQLEQIENELQRHLKNLGGLDFPPEDPEGELGPV